MHKRSAPFLPFSWHKSKNWKDLGWYLSCMAEGWIRTTALHKQEQHSAWVTGWWRTTPASLSNPSSFHDPSDLPHNHESHSRRLPTDQWGTSGRMMVRKKRFRIQPLSSFTPAWTCVQGSVRTLHAVMNVSSSGDAKLYCWRLPGCAVTPESCFLLRLTLPQSIPIKFLFQIKQRWII